MPSKSYPEHDINQVFDMIQAVIAGGGVADNAMEEMSFINRLFAALPVGGGRGKSQRARIEGNVARRNGRTVGGGQTE